MDRLQRDGATYLAKGEADLLSGNDAWFMPVELKIGPDGCLYVLDWYDRYHCSQDAARDPEGVDRLKGRLYRLRYQNTPRAPRINLANESDDQLIARLASGNLYFRETAQRILTERLGTAPRELRAKLESLVLSGAATAAVRKARLHALWALIGSGALESAFHLKLLAHSEPAYRAWGVRAAGNQGEVSAAIRRKVAELAADPTPDVQLQVAIASRKIKDFDALPVLYDVLAHCGQDKLIPSIAWNNLHPLLETESAPFVSLIRSNASWPPALAALSPRIVERMLSNQKLDACSVAAFIQFVADRDSECAKQCLSEVSSRLNTLPEPALNQLKADLKPLLEGGDGKGNGCGEGNRKCFGVEHREPVERSNHFSECGGHRERWQAGPDHSGRPNPANAFGPGSVAEFLCREWALDEARGRGCGKFFGEHKSVNVEGSEACGALRAEPIASVVVRCGTTDEAEPKSIAALGGDSGYSKRCFFEQPATDA